MELSAVDYVWIAIIAVSIVFFVTPLVVRLAWRRQLLDVPGGHKGQDSPVPYLGGVVMVVGLSAAVVLLPSLKRGAWVPDELLLILGLAVVLALVGLVDDLRGVSRLLRLLVEVGAAAAMFDSGVRVHMFSSDALDLAVTILWIVGIINAFNLLDNMDGLTAGVSCIASLTFFVLALQNGQDLVAALSLAVAGCALGFLRHNFHPATIYMGDAGALFLGFVLAVLGLKLRFDSAPQEVTFFVPIVTLGVAIFDTSLVTVARLLHRRSPFLGARDHTSHRLVYVGLSVRVAVGLIYIAAATLAWLAVIMSRLDGSTAYLLMGLVLTIGVLSAALLGAVPIYETSQRRRLMIREVAKHDEHGGQSYLQKPA